jgi:hypothetical protein
MNKFDSDIIYYGQTLYDWIDIVHTIICDESELAKFDIDGYGFDSYASILNIILSNIDTPDVMSYMKNNLDLDKYVDLAHRGWSKNYIHWKNLILDDQTDDPTQTINTYDRNNRATTHSTNLNKNDLALYYTVIRLIFEILTKKILEAGMQNLSIQ